MPNIYVLNKDGTPLMPVHSYGRAKRMVKSGKARVYRMQPFTLILCEQKENPQVDECLLGIDPGRTNIGLCVVDSRGRVLFASDIETRNKAIKKLMLEKKRARQASRRGERKVRQRREIASDKTGMARHTEFWRMLPGYKKPLCCKVMRNQPAKFEHRKRKKGWLTPTASHLLETHINAVNLVRKLLPVSTIVIEVNRFDFARMENPGIRDWEYCMGRLAGYKNVNEAVDIIQNGRCLLCGKKKIRYHHHIVPKSLGGSDTIDNIAGLCHECHYGENGVHKSETAAGRLKGKKNGLRKKYHALSVINQVMPYVLERLAGMLPVCLTAGWETQAARKKYMLPEKQKDDGTHYMDAWCIAVSALQEEPQAAPEFTGSFYLVKQYRRHDRARIKAQKERTYYLDGKAVAHNRHKRTGQSDTKEKWDSLAEFRESHPKDVSRLTVRKSTRSYNNIHRAMPGTVFRAPDGCHVLQASQSGGTKYWAYDNENDYYPAGECTVVKKNTGLVFVGRR